MIYKKSEIFEILIKNKAHFNQYGVTRLGLFGSYSRNEQNETSDIDFLVEFENDKKTFRNFMKLVFFLESLFDKKLEIVTPQSLSKFMYPKIIKDVEYVIST